MADKVFVTKEEVLQRLEAMQKELLNIRDKQYAIKCTDKDDICNDFDRASDALSELMVRFK